MKVLLLLAFVSFIKVSLSDVTPSGDQSSILEKLFGSFVRYKRTPGPESRDNDSLLITQKDEEVVQQTEDEVDKKPTRTLFSPTPHVQPILVTPVLQPMATYPQYGYPPVVSYPYPMQGPYRSSNHPMNRLITIPLSQVLITRTVPPTQDCILSIEGSYQMRNRRHSISRHHPNRIPTRGPGSLVAP